jgi:hypothetical protein
MGYDPIVMRSFFGVPDEYPLIQQNHPCQFDPILRVTGIISDSNLVRITLNPNSTDDLNPAIIWVGSRNTLGLAGTGWHLVFQGEMDVSLGFAGWDDRVGVEGLIASMRDQEFLMTTTALLNPQRSNQIAVKQNFYNAYQRKEFSSMEIPRIREFIKENNLMVDTHSYRKFETFFITVNATAIPLAIVLESNYEPLPVAREHINKSRSAWLERFARLSINLLQWRSITDPRKHQQFFSDSDVAWFTSITPEQWSSLDLDKIVPLARLKGYDWQM